MPWYHGCMSGSTKDDDSQPMSVRFPRDVHDALRRKAFTERTAMNTLIVEAVREKLSGWIAGPIPAPSGAWPKTKAGPAGGRSPTPPLTKPETFMMADGTTRIRATHPYGFRCGEWARLITTIPANGRDCYLVEFEDGVTDIWVKDDFSDPYEFSPPEHPRPGEFL